MNLGDESRAAARSVWRGRLDRSGPFRGNIRSMTELLEKAVRVARQLSPDEQDDIARAIMRLAGSDDSPLIPLTDDERAAIDRSKAAAARGDFASDKDVEAVWSKHGP